MCDSDAAYWQRQAQHAREEVAQLRQALESADKRYWALLKHIADLKSMQMPPMFIAANQFTHIPGRDDGTT